jgi:hypothetical protein
MADSNEADLFTFSVDEPDYLSVFSHSDVLESLFQVSFLLYKAQIKLLSLKRTNFTIYEQPKN